VRPHPKHSLVLGSIMQTAMHGVSVLMHAYWRIDGAFCKHVLKNPCPRS
jgi:hypothetical protein